jgi:hypothetical protein
MRFSREKLCGREGGDIFYRKVKSLPLLLPTELQLYTTSPFPSPRLG